MEIPRDQELPSQTQADTDNTPPRQDDPVLDIFLKRLESKLEEKNLTRSGLAERLELSRNAISQFFLRKRRPNIDTLLKIADALSVSVDFLVGRKEMSEVDALLQQKRVVDLVDGFAQLSPAEQESVMNFIHALILAKHAGAENK